MTIKAVEAAIERIRAVVAEWDSIEVPGRDEPPGWGETHTRYAIIDPILRGLGWDTTDPKECHPEYPRPYPTGRVDYALFGEWSAVDIEGGSIEPAVIVEAKALRGELDEHLDQLEQYATIGPPMVPGDGMAVLTNGNEWRMYDIGDRGVLLRRSTSWRTTAIRLRKPCTSCWDAIGGAKTDCPARRS